jgi:hypothetical protein
MPIYEDIHDRIMHAVNRIDPRDCLILGVARYFSYASGRSRAYRSSLRENAPEDSWLWKNKTKKENMGEWRKLGKQMFPSYWIEAFWLCGWFRFQLSQWIHGSSRIHLAISVWRPTSVRFPRRNGPERMHWDYGDLRCLLRGALRTRSAHGKKIERWKLWDYDPILELVIPVSCQLLIAYLPQDFIVIRTNSGMMDAKQSLK